MWRHKLKGQKTTTKAEYAMNKWKWIKVSNVSEWMYKRCNVCLITGTQFIKPDTAHFEKICC